MTKKEQRQAQLDRHYNSLNNLYKLNTGEDHPNPKRLSSTLLRLEREAHRETVGQMNDDIGEQCNEDGDYIESDKRIEAIKEKVLKLFKGNLNGFFINYDARGYAMKIKTEAIGDTGLYRDFGGYGILAPEIN